jgi:hypothetical protein
MRSGNGAFVPSWNTGTRKVSEARIERLIGQRSATLVKRTSIFAGHIFYLEFGPDDVSAHPTQSAAHKDFARINGFAADSTSARRMPRAINSEGASA